MPYRNTMASASASPTLGTEMEIRQRHIGAWHDAFNVKEGDPIR